MVQQQGFHWKVLLAKYKLVFSEKIVVQLPVLYNCGFYLEELNKYNFYSIHPIFTKNINPILYNVVYTAKSNIGFYFYLK